MPYFKKSEVGDRVLQKKKGSRVFWNVATIGICIFLFFGVISVGVLVPVSELQEGGEYRPGSNVPLMSWQSYKVVAGWVSVTILFLMVLLYVVLKRSSTGGTKSALAESPLPQDTRICLRCQKFYEHTFRKQCDCGEGLVQIDDVLWLPE